MYLGNYIGDVGSALAHLGPQLSDVTLLDVGADGLDPGPVDTKPLSVSYSTDPGGPTWLIVLHRIFLTPYSIRPPQVPTLSFGPAGRHERAKMNFFARGPERSALPLGHTPRLYTLMLRSV